MIFRIVFSLPLLGLLGCVLWPVIGFATFLIWLSLIVLALLGRRFKVPLLGDWAETLAR
jgi:uncharacterized membrane protein